MTIAQIKQQLSIVRVLEHYGLVADKNNRLCCPFHDDKTPSMQIYPKTNTYCCFSTNCHAGTGDVIDFIQLQEKCTKHQAILKAKQLCSVMESNQEQSTSNFSRQGIINRFWESCREGIKRSKNGQAYLKERCIEKVEVGYCSEKSMKNWSSELQEAARKVGLLKSTNRPHFQYCIVFPLKNEKGEVVSLYGRGIQDKRHVYLSGTHQGLYPGFPEKSIETLLITESVVDAASLSSIEMSVLALYGAKSWTEEHQKAVSILTNLSEVILFFDGDAAGKEGEKYITEKLRADLSLRSRLKITAVPIPEGEDVNSLLVAHEPEVLQHLIEKREAFSLSSENTEGKEKDERTKSLTHKITPSLTYTSNNR